MKLHILTFLIVGSVLFSSSIADAQTTQTPVLVTVTRAWVQGNENRSDAGFGDRVVVEVEHMAEAIQINKLNPHDLVLFLNGQAVKGLKVVAIEVAGNKNEHYRLAFDLKRTTESDQVWRALLGSPGWKDNYREVGVSVGFPDKQAFPQSEESYRPVLYLRLYNRWWAVGSLVFMAVLLGLFITMAIIGNVIRDSDPPKLEDGKKKPYSLALTQAAWWFFLVIGSFGFIYLITGDYNTMTDQALILMGIGTGTALGAFMINVTKRNTADTDLSALLPAKAKLDAEVNQFNASSDPVLVAAKQTELVELNKKIADAEAALSKPFSEGFRKDILTDVNGIALHRFQMVIWTIVLGVVFLLGVYRDLAMPEFSASLLALLGISAGTYLGFKIPERQN